MSARGGSQVLHHNSWAFNLNINKSGYIFPCGKQRSFGSITKLVLWLFSDLYIAFVLLESQALARFY